MNKVLMVLKVLIMDRLTSTLTRRLASPQCYACYPLLLAAIDAKSPFPRVGVPERRCYTVDRSPY